MIRKFGAIGDVHAEDELLAAAIERLDAIGVDAVLSVGDVVDGAGDVERCVRLLQARGAVAVRGNHERWLLAGTMRQLPHATSSDALSDPARAWLGSLPATRTLVTSAGRLLLCHGVGEDDMTRLLPEDEGAVLTSNPALQDVLASGAELMVCGHTHRPMVRSIFGLLVINAGTLDRRDAPGFVHVDLDAKVARFFDLELDPVRVREGLVVPFGAPGQDVWGAGF